MNVTSACPGLDGLQAYLLGRTPDAPASALEEHLASCPECQNRLPSIPAEDDFVTAFRGQAGRPRPSDPHLDRLAELLRHLVRTVPSGLDATTPAVSEATPSAVPSPQPDATQELSVALGPPQQPDEIGRLGGYRILKELGRGGMGVVYQTDDPKLKRLVALKAMLPKLAADRASHQRFLREAQAMASVHHDHIVTIFQVDEDKGVPYLAMEFLQGMPLDKWLKEGRKATVAQVLRLGREIADGLAAAHERGLIHRDIKPGNIWLDSDHKGRVKILDFGLARTGTEDVHLTSTGAIVGTPAYMAPEQARGEKVDARSDLFSLGCVLYKLCTGVLLFVGDTTMSLLMSLALDRPKAVRDLNPQTPSELSDLVMKLLEKDPARRPVSAREVVQVIQNLERQLARNKEVHAPTLSLPIAPLALAAAVAAPRPVARRRRRLALIAAAVLALGGIIGVGTAALIHIQTDQGDYVIKADDPDFSFRVHDGAVKLEDHKNNKTYTLKVVKQNKDAKEVEMEVGDGGDLVFKTKTFSIKRGEKAVVTAWFEPKAVAVAPRAAKVDDAWMKEVAAMAPEKQVEPVAAKLKERNPGFDGKLTHEIEGGVVTRLDFMTDEVTDISPVQALTGLTYLACIGDQRNPSKLSDLSPLKGLPLKYLGCSGTQVSDLSPLKGMKLTSLVCGVTQVSDLSPLKGMPLTSLNCGATQVSDLSPLRDMKQLTELYCFATKVADLSPLKGAPIRLLVCAGTPVNDLSPLKGLPLTSLECGATKISDLSPLEGMRLWHLDCCDTQASTLAPLKGMPLSDLRFRNTPVSDLSPLKGMPLGILEFSNTKVSDLSPLKGMKLGILHCGAAAVSDLSPLKGMPLNFLSCAGAAVSDLSPLKGMPLKYLGLDDTKVTDLTPVSGLPLTDLYFRRNRDLQDLSPLKGMKLKTL